MTDKKKRITFVCALSLVTAALCIPVFFAGNAAAVHRAAENRLKTDISEKKKEYDSVVEEKKQLDGEISAYTADIESNSGMNVKMKEHEEKTAALTAEIEQEKAKGAQLDAALDEAKKASEQSKAASPEQTLSTLKADTYSCPADIEAGSYTISAAEGNIVIYGTNNAIRVSKSLSLLDGNEYTVQIKDGERLRVDKDVSIRGSGRIKKNQTNSN